MGTIRRPENLMKPVKLTATTLRLPSGSTLNIGAMQYNLTANLDLNTAVTGVGGVDATIAAGGLYYVYAVVSSNVVYLIASLNSALPSGFTLARQVGGFTTNASSQIDQVGEYPGNLAVAGSVSAGGGVAAYSPQNYIINGAFDFWQRGTSFSADGYSADRWYYLKIGTATAARSTTVPDSRFKYSCKITAGASSSVGVLRHCIETDNIIPLRGKVVTFSFYAVTLGAAYTGNYQVGLAYSNSTDARVSQATAVPNAPALNITPSTSWKLITYTFTVPLDAMGLQFSITHTDSQAAGNEFYVTGVMLNIGTSAAPFQRAGGTVGGELSLCERYCEIATGDSVNGGAIGWGVATGTGTAMISFPFRTTKRSATSTLIKIGTVYLLDSGGNKNATFTRDMTSDQSGLISVTGATGLTTGNFVAANTYTGALGFECEL